MNSHEIIAVTGANGFVGSALGDALVRSGRSVRRIVRSERKGDFVAVGDIGQRTDWSKALEGVDCVIHTAAHVHVTNTSSASSAEKFREVNVEGTRQLAVQAARAGVRRFIYLSSVKVNGEMTRPGIPFMADDDPAPLDVYGESKWLAEQELCSVCKRAGMKYVIIRPPLIYGPGVKGNFLSLMRAIAAGFPLPLGSVKNRRSLVALGNLVDLIIICIDRSSAENRTFLVSDGDDLSTTELVKRLGIALGRQARLYSVPVWVIGAVANLLGKGGAVSRLFGSLQVDIDKTRQVLNWSPPVTVEEELRKTADYYLEKRQQ